MLLRGTTVAPSGGLGGLVLVALRNRVVVVRPVGEHLHMQLPENLAAGDIWLRRWRSGDAPGLLQAVRSSLPELQSYMAWATDDHGPDEVKEYLDGSDAGWNDGTAWNYAVLAAEGRIVGSCGLMTRMGPGVLEIGYWIRSADAGRGYATALARALADEALAVPGIERVVIKHDKLNVASGRVAEKAGFTRTGTIRADITAPGHSGVQVVWERVTSA